MGRACLVKLVDAPEMFGNPSPKEKVVPELIPMLQALFHDQIFQPAKVRSEIGWARR